MPEEMDSSYGETAPKGSPGKPESVDEEKAEHPETIVDKSILPGKKVGDTCTFRIANDYGEEFGLEYVKEGDSYRHTDESMGADEELEQMDKA